MHVVKVSEPDGSQAVTEPGQGKYTILSADGRPLNGQQIVPRPTKEEIRQTLALAVRRVLDMDVDDFIRDYHAGRWPDPDGEPNIMSLIALYEHTL